MSKATFGRCARAPSCTSCQPSSCLTSWPATGLPAAMTWSTRRAALAALAATIRPSFEPTATPSRSPRRGRTSDSAKPTIKVSLTGQPLAVVDRRVELLRHAWVDQQRFQRAKRVSRAFEDGGRRWRSRWRWRPGVAVAAAVSVGAAVPNELPSSRLSWRPLPSPIAARWAADGRPATWTAGMGAARSALRSRSPGARASSPVSPGRRSTRERNSYSRKRRRTSPRS